MRAHPDQTAPAPFTNAMLDRRTVLASLGLSLALAGCAALAPDAPPVATGAVVPAPTPTALPRPLPGAIPPPVAVPLPTPALVRVGVPSGTLSGLPGEGSLLAWTVDDGSSSDVVARYAQFAADTGIRLTFFVTGCYDAWTDNAQALRPLVASGQIQLGNHTWSHPDLSTLADAEVTTELSRNHDFITDQQVVDFATTWFLPQHIVIGHLNFDPVTRVFPQLLGLLHERALTAVTLNDVFTSAAHP